MLTGATVTVVSEIYLYGKLYLFVDMKPQARYSRFSSWLPDSASSIPTTYLVSNLIA